LSAGSVLAADATVDVRHRSEHREARPFRRAAKPLALAQPNALNPVFFRSNLHR
jgi:hypothetical protein